MPFDYAASACLWSPNAAAKEKFNYNASARLWRPAVRKKRKGSSHYRHFDTVAEAIRHMIEEVPATLVNGLVLEIEGQLLTVEAIQALYNSDDYPFKLPDRLR
jgi:hypothetical protein